MNNLTKFALFLTIGAGALYLLTKDDDNATNILKGGRGDDLTEDDVDPKELAMGMKVEMEHTDDEDVAKEIALDHLAEDPEYYTKLKTIHKNNPKIEEEEEEEEEEEDEEEEEEDEEEE